MDAFRPSTAPTATRTRIHRVDDLSYNLERTLANVAAEPTLRAPPWENQPGVASALFASSTARRAQIIKAQVDALDPHKPIEVVRDCDLPSASLRQTMTGGYYLTDDSDAAPKKLGKTFASRAGSGPLIPGTVAADTANFGRPSTASSVRKPRTPLDTSRMLSDIPLSRDVLSHPTTELASVANAAVPARTIRLQMPSKQARPVRPLMVRPEMHHGRHRNAIAPSHQRFVEALEDDIEELMKQLVKAKESALQSIEDLMDPAWRPPVRMEVQSFMQAAQKPAGILTPDGRHVYQAAKQANPVSSTNAVRVP